MALTNKELQAYRKQLLKLREEVESLSTASADGRRPVELDQQVQGRLSRMDALLDQQMALAREERRRNEIKRIDAALERIADGEFGFCTTCGEDIEKKRLDYDPTVPTCIDCAGG